MKSTYKLIWTEEALNNLKSIITYIERNWSDMEISKFANKLDHRLNLITQNPRLFPKVNKSEVRKAVLLKQVSIFYVLARLEIRILFIFDNRQNPEKLRLS